MINLLAPLLPTLTKGLARAIKPNPVTPAAQAVQQVKRPTQATPIAPQAASPTPITNAQGTGNAAIPPVRREEPVRDIPTPPVAFQQQGMDLNPFYQQARSNWEQQRGQINDWYNQSVNFVQRDEGDGTSQLEENMLQTDMFRQLRDAQMERDRILKGNTAALNAYQNAQNKLLAARKAEQDAFLQKESKRIREAAIANNIGAESGITNQEVADLEKSVLLKNNELSAQVETAIADKFAQLENARLAAEDAWRSRAESINSQFVNAKIQIAKERGLSQRKKEEAMLNLRSKMIDDLRQNDQNFQTNQLNLQKQYADTYDQQLKVSDLLGYFGNTATPTLARDRLSETVRSNNLDYAVDMERVAQTWAKINKARGGSGGSTTMTAQEASDLANQLSFWMKPKEMGGPGYTFEEAQNIILAGYSGKAKTAAAQDLQGILMGNQNALAQQGSSNPLSTMLSKVPLIGSLFGGEPASSSAVPYITADATQKKTPQGADGKDAIKNAIAAAIKKRAT